MNDKIEPFDSFPTEIMKTKTVTVTWTELVHMSNTIQVPEDWTEEDILNDPDGIMFDGAKDNGCEIETDSVSILITLF
jgi:hypothetical protein